MSTSRQANPPSATVDEAATGLVWHGRNGKRTVSLSAAAIVTAATLSSIVAIGMAGFSTYDVLQSSFSDAQATRQASIRRDYEDRIAELRTRVDIVTSRQLIDQREVEARMGVLLAKQAELGARQAHVTNAAMRTGVDLPSITTRPAARPKANVAPSGLRLGSLVGTTSPFEAELPTVAHTPTVFAEVETSLAETERMQVAEVTAIHNEAVRKARDLSDILAKRGVRVPASGTGGPLIELKGAGDFMATVSKLDATLETLDQVRRAARAVPHGSPAPGREVSSRFGARRDPFTKRSAMHGGMDFRAPRGAKVVATADGKVTKAGRLGGYGKLVEIDHGGGITTRYAHLSRIKVQTGPAHRAWHVDRQGRLHGPFHRPTFALRSASQGSCAGPAPFREAGKETAALPVGPLTRHPRRPCPRR